MGLWSKIENSRLGKAVSSAYNDTKTFSGEDWLYTGLTGGLYGAGKVGTELSGIAESAKAKKERKAEEDIQAGLFAEQEALRVSQEAMIESEQEQADEEAKDRRRRRIKGGRSSLLFGNNAVGIQPQNNKLGGL